MVTLYTANACPFAQRARLALTAKGVEHERVEIDLRDMPTWFRELSPNECVPLLRHDDRKIWESLVVAYYVDEAFEGPPLMPPQPYERALVRLGIETAGSLFLPLFFKLVKGEVENPAEKIQETWAKLEATMSSHGLYWAGAELSIADLSIFPWFERWPVIEHYTPDHLQMKLTPRLKNWLDAVQKHPAVVQERSEPDVYIEAYGRFVTEGAARR